MKHVLDLTFYNFCKQYENNAHFISSLNSSSYLRYKQNMYFLLDI